MVKTCGLSAHSKERVKKVSLVTVLPLSGMLPLTFLNKQWMIEGTSNNVKIQTKNGMKDQPSLSFSEAAIQALDQSNTSALLKLDCDAAVFKNVSIDGLEFDLVPGCHFPGLSGHKRKSNMRPQSASVTFWCRSIKFQKTADGAELMMKLAKKSPTNPWVIFSRGLQFDERTSMNDTTKKASVMLGQRFFPRETVCCLRVSKQGMRNCAMTTAENCLLLVFLQIPPPKPAMKHKDSSFLLAPTTRDFSAVQWCALGCLNATAGDTNDIVISGKMDRNECFAALANAKFCLVHRGNGRWNDHLCDIVSQGCLPVFMANGLDPPFSGHMRWNVASVALREELALDLESITENLRSMSCMTLTSMRNNAVRIFHECFQDQSGRANCLLKSVQLFN